MKKIIGILVLVIVLVMTLTSCATSSELDTQSTVNDQQNIYNQNQPIHTYNYSVERDIVQQLYDFRVTKLVSTWTVWLAQGTGEPIDMCASKGYPIPYNTSLTNPEQTAWSNYADSSVIAQAEPNGLYPGGSTSATWVLCVESDGTLHPRYVESEVIAYDYPVEIRFDEQSGRYRIVRVGDPTGESNITVSTDTGN